MLYESRLYRQGAEFLGNWLVNYQVQAPYHSHINWHFAMCELMLGRGQQALEVYRRAIDPASVRPPRTTLADAVGLLWRCHLSVAVASPLPWAGIRDYAAGMGEPALAFRTVLAGTALAGAGDHAALANLADALKLLAVNGDALAGAVVMPLVEGMHAFAREDYAKTIRLFESIVDQTWRIGGSNEQRELFDETLMEACLRMGQGRRAEAIVRKRMVRTPSARDPFWLARSQAGRVA